MYRTPLEDGFLKEEQLLRDPTSAGSTSTSTCRENWSLQEKMCNEDNEFRVYFYNFGRSANLIWHSRAALQ